MSGPLEPLMVFDVEVGPPVTIDAATGQGRRFIPILGGTVSGRHTGRILPGGGDWQHIHADGRLELTAQYILELDGGATVEVLSQGVRQGPPEVLARLARGETVDPSEYYFRTSIRLRTAAPELAYLNARLCIAYGARMASRVRIDVHEVL
jgi:hypothetical protein